MKTIRIEKTDSTNSHVAREAESFAGDVLLYAVEQSAGRGQRGNSWEAEPGKNLTASLLLHPTGVEANCQFAISEAVALGVVRLLARHGVQAKVKWPNDVYAGNRKICGILIENSLLGNEIRRTIAGVGININQERFMSDAPNPVSYFQLTGSTLDIAETASELASTVEETMKEAATPEGRERLHAAFIESLWRGDGKLHPFADKRTGRKLMASITSIAPNGILTLTDSSGERREYAFKEVEFILDSQ